MSSHGDFPILKQSSTCRLRMLVATKNGNHFVQMFIIKRSEHVQCHKLLDTFTLLNSWSVVPMCHEDAFSYIALETICVFCKSGSIAESLPPFKQHQARPSTQ